VNALDWSILAAYFLVVLIIGALSGTRVKTLFEYFLAGRSFGVLPVALSIIATETSAATLIGGPDTAYRGDLAYLQTAIGAFISRVVLAALFLDVYYRHNVYTVYQFLAQRFSPGYSWEFLPSTA
jgi:Na+/proline symporter